MSTQTPTTTGGYAGLLNSANPSQPTPSRKREHRQPKSAHQITIKGAFLNFRVGRTIRTSRGTIYQPEAREALLVLGDVESKKMQEIRIYPVSGFVPTEGRTYEVTLWVRPGRPWMAEPKWLTLEPSEARGYLDCPARELEQLEETDNLYRHRPSGIVVIVPAGRKLSLADPHAEIRLGTGCNSVLVYMGPPPVKQEGEARITVSTRIMPELLEFRIGGRGQIIGQPRTVNPYQLLKLRPLSSVETVHQAADGLRTEILREWHPDKLLANTAIRDKDRQRLIELLPTIIGQIDTAERWMVEEREDADAVMRVALANQGVTVTSKIPANMKPPAPKTAKKKAAETEKRRPRSITHAAMRDMAPPWKELLEYLKIGLPERRNDLAIAIVSRLLYAPLDTPPADQMSDNDLLSLFYEAGVPVSRTQHLLKEVRRRQAEQAAITPKK